MGDYQKSFTVNKPAGEVYDAITNHVADWWSNDFSGNAARTGDSYTIAFGNTRKTMNIAEAVPNEKVVWNCVKAYIDYEPLKNKSEWEGTEMIWTMTPAEGATTIDFLHKGLNREMECYGICEAGWDTFLSSLEAYLSTGKGKPYQKQGGE